MLGNATLRISKYLHLKAVMKIKDEKAILSELNIRTKVHLRKNLFQKGKNCINLLKLTGYVMQKHVLTFNNCTLCPHHIYVFCIYLRTKSDFCPM